jgi:phosphatidylglycerophosphate synthase
MGRRPTVVGVKHNQFFGMFVASFLVWVIGPVERLLVGRVSPNAITAASLLMCAITGAAAGLGHLGGAVWCYAVAGILDILDGRLARLNNQQSASGALFDSVSDRWGEMFAFAGFAWYLRDTVWLLAVLGAIGGSMMVSYTRARAEGLKIQLSGGIMQRAERMVLVSAGTLIAAWYGASPDGVEAVVPILGGTMLVCAVASTATALNRWVVAYRILSKRDADNVVAAKKAKVVEEPAKDAVTPEIFAPIPKSLRESAELPL